MAALVVLGDLASRHSFTMADLVIKPDIGNLSEFSHISIIGNTMYTICSI